LIDEIRPVVTNDPDELVELCLQHAKIERAEYSLVRKADRLGRALFGASPKLRCLVAATGEGLIGYAAYMRAFSTWDAGDYLHMDCLFLRPMARSHGVGAALMKRVVEEARSMRCEVIQWQTPVFNTRAMKFYERLGATANDKRRFYLAVARRTARDRVGASLRFNRPLETELEIAPKVSEVRC